MGATRARTSRGEDDASPTEQREDAAAESGGRSRTGEADPPARRADSPPRDGDPPAEQGTGTAADAAGETAAAQGLRRSGALDATNVGAFIGVVALVLVAGRLLIVSGYSFETAYALIQETGAANVGLGAMLAFLPFVAALCWFVAFILAGLSFWRQRAGRAWWRWPVLILLLGPASFMVPIGYMVPLLLLGLMVMAEERRASAQGNGSNRSYTARTGVSVLLAIAAFPLLTSGNPWLAPERVQLTGQRPFTAYVLSTENGTVALLKHEPREVLRVDEDRVQSRRICSFQDGKGRWDRFWDVAGAPLWTQRTEKPDYPPCPRSD